MSSAAQRIGASFLIELGWPNKALSPNAREHYMVVARARKAARKEGYFATLAAMMKGNAPKWTAKEIAFVITAYPPDKRQRDDDNIKASLKSARDGIAQALGINDGRFLERFQWGEPVKGGKIVVEVRA